jgi:hypothetical protein
MFFMVPICYCDAKVVWRARRFDARITTAGAILLFKRERFAPMSRCARTARTASLAGPSSLFIAMAFTIAT